MGFFDFLSENGNILEEKNLGRPKSIEVWINPPINTPDFLPQAWEYNGNRYYNFKGASVEAEFLGKKIPTINEWTKIIESKTGENLLKVLSLDGLYDWSLGYVTLQNIMGNYWSSSVSGYNALCFTANNVKSTKNTHEHANGFSVRCLKK